VKHLETIMQHALRNRIKQQIHMMIDMLTAATNYYN